MQHIISALFGLFIVLSIIGLSVLKIAAAVSNDDLPGAFIWIIVVMIILFGLIGLREIKVASPKRRY